MNTSIALPSRRFSGEQAKRDGAAVAPAANVARGGAVDADRQLRRDQHERAVAQMREQQRRTLPNDRLDVGAVVVVDRRVERDPDDVGAGDGGRDVGGEAQASGWRCRA